MSVHFEKCKPSELKIKLTEFLFDGKNKDFDYTTSICDVNLYINEGNDTSCVPLVQFGRITDTCLILEMLDQDLMVDAELFSNIYQAISSINESFRDPYTLEVD